MDVLTGLLREHRDRMVFFAGAGVSVPSGLPAFEALTAALLDHVVGDAAPPDTRTALSQALRPEVAFQVVLQETGDAALHVLTMLEGRPPNANHLFLAEALRAGHTVVTTNLDTLVEDACARRGIPYDLVASNPEFQALVERPGAGEEAFRGKLLKLHGTLGPAEQGTKRFESVRIALDQVAMGLSEPKAAALRRLLETCDFCFLGYSGLDDFTVTPILLETETARRAYWFVYDKAPLGQLVWGRRAFQEAYDDAAGRLRSGGSHRDLSALNVHDFLLRRRMAFKMVGESSAFTREVVLDGLGLPPPGPDPAPASNPRPPHPEYDALRARDPAARAFLAARLCVKASHLAEAQRLLRPLTDLPAGLGIRSRILLGETQAGGSTAAHYAQAVPTLRSAAEAAARDGEPLLDVSARVALANVQRRAQDLDGALRSLDDAERALQAAGGRATPSVALAEARLQNVRGLVHAVRGEHADAIALCASARKTFLDAGDLAGAAAGANALGLVQVDAAAAAAGRADLATALPLLAAGAASLEEARGYAKKIGDRTIVFQACRNLARGLILRADWNPGTPEARACADQAIPLLEEGDKSLDRIVPPKKGEKLEIAFRLAEAHEIAGRPDQAAPHWRRALAGQAEDGAWFRVARIAARRASLTTPPEIQKSAAHAALDMMERLLDPARPEAWRKRMAALHQEACRIVDTIQRILTRLGDAEGAARAERIGRALDALEG